MTLEELDIIVQASIEPAMKELKKLMPQIKQQVSQAVEVAQETMNKIDMKSVSNKIQKALQFVKKKIDNLRKSSQNNEIAIKINNIEAKKQITQLEKEIDSLQKKISSRQMKLNIVEPQIDKIINDTKSSVTPEGIPQNSNALDTLVNNTLASNKDFTTLNSQAQKLYTEIEMYNKELNQAKSKISQLKQETNQTATSQSKLTSFFSTFKGKLDEAKGGISSFKNTFNQMPKITQNITNNIKGMSKGLKSGLGHILKYATALFSLRGIYSVLSQSAQSWLSSQNAGAQQLSANIEYMKYAMGSALAPVIQFVTNLVYQLMKAIQSVAYALTGVNIFAKATALSMKNTSKSAKETSKSLAGVHSEINNVSENNNSGNGDNSVSPNMDLSKLDNMPNSIVEAIKNGDWYAIGATIGEKLNNAMESIPWNKIKNTAKKIGRKTAEYLNGFIATTDWKQVGNTFAQGVNTIIDIGYEFVTTFDWKKFGTSIGETVNGFFKNTDFSKAGTTFGEGIKGIFNLISSFLEEVDWAQMAKNVEDFLKNVDWSGIAQSLFEAIGSALGGLAEFLGTLISDAFTGIETYFQDKIEECGGNVVAGILKGIGDAILGIGQWIYENIFLPFINGFKEAFGIHSPSTVMEEQGNFIIEGLYNGLIGIWDKVKSIFENFVNNVAEKFSNIKENILNTWENIKTTAQEKWNSIKDSVSEKWENIKSTATEKFRNIKDSVSETWDNIKTTAQEKWNSIKESIGNKWENIKTIATEKFGNIKDKVSEAWTNITKDKEMSNMMTIIKDKFSNLGQNASTWGKDLVTNMSNGIKNNISKVTSAVNSVASKIKGLLGFSEPEEGPLSNFHTYMPDMIDLMVSGIKSNMSRVTDELENMTAQMSYTINTPDISPLSINESGINSNMIQPRNIMEETLSDLLSYNNGNSNISIPLSVYVGNKKLGEILLDNLRDKKRQTGKDLEALVGG